MVKYIWLIKLLYVLPGLILWCENSYSKTFCEKIVTVEKKIRLRTMKKSLKFGVENVTKQMFPLRLALRTTRKGQQCFSN